MDHHGFRYHINITFFRIDINGDKTIMKNYKCPVVVDVSITLKLVESKGTTSGRNYYGFDRLPRTNKDKSATNEASPSNLNAQKFDDANTNESMAVVESGETMNQTTVNTKRDDNTNVIKVEQPKFTAKGPEFDAFGNVTNAGKFPTTRKSTGPEFDAFGNITNEGQF